MNQSRASLPYTAVATMPGSNPELDAMYQDARRQLDDSGEERPAESTALLLQSIIERDPEYAGAYVELARWVLKSSYRFTYSRIDEFQPEGVEIARQLLGEAMRVEPRFADSFVLYAYLAPSLQRPSLGLIALDHAEALGTDSYWLHLNRAMIQSIVGDTAGARSSYRELRRHVKSGSDADVAALSALTQLGDSVRETIRYYEELLTWRPDTVWVRQNFADFLLLEGRFDETISLLVEADIRNGDASLAARRALAYYAKGANLQLRENDPDNAVVYFGLAEQQGYSREAILLNAALWDSTRDIVPILVARGADINVRNRGGQSALFHYITNTGADDVRDLLAMGADRNVATRAVGRRWPWPSMPGRGLWWKHCSRPARIRTCRDMPTLLHCRQLAIKVRRPLPCCSNARARRCHDPNGQTSSPAST